MRKGATVRREIRRSMAPVGIRCKLCRLDINQPDMGAQEMDVSYPVAGLRSRFVWICDECAEAITNLSRWLPGHPCAEP